MCQCECMIWQCYRFIYLSQLEIASLLIFSKLFIAIIISFFIYVVILTWFSRCSSKYFLLNMPDCWKCTVFIGLLFFSALDSCSALLCSSSFLLLLAAATVVSPQGSLKMYNFTHWKNQIVKGEHVWRVLTSMLKYVGAVSKLLTADSWLQARAETYSLCDPACKSGSVHYTVCKLCLV